MGGRIEREGREGERRIETEGRKLGRRYGRKRGGREEEEEEVRWRKRSREAEDKAILTGTCYSRQHFPQ